MVQEENRKKFVLPMGFLIMMKRNRSMLRKTARMSFNHQNPGLDKRYQEKKCQTFKDSYQPCCPKPGSKRCATSHSAGWCSVPVVLSALCGKSAGFAGKQRVIRNAWLPVHPAVKQRGTAYIKIEGQMGIGVDSKAGLVIIIKLSSIAQLAERAAVNC